MNSTTLKKMVYTSLGWTSFVLGVIGIFLPLMPTVVFWIIAVWFWSKGSPQLMERVYKHPQYGSSVKAFMQHGIVSRTGKYAAISSMTLSYLLILVLASPVMWISLTIGAVLIMVALWLITRPETIQTF
ncbi:MAG: YbaN family protein [Thiotrichaceae bacterium]